MNLKTPKKGLRRTDLASELIRPRVIKTDEWISETTVAVTASDAAAIGKPAGIYTSVVSPAVLRNAPDIYPRLIAAMSKILRKYLKGANDVLVIGLGNPAMKADSLGAETVSRATVGGKIKTLLPSVSAATGIESFDVIRAVTREIKPKAVIVADALCAASGKRLGTVFQIADAGITPGSGVGNARREISHSTLGVPVISVGVPTVVYARTVAREAGGDGKKADEIIFTLSEIDRVAKDAGGVIGEAINAAMGATRENSCARADKVI